MSRKVELDFEDAQALYDAADSWLNELVEYIEPDRYNGYRDLPEEELPSTKLGVVMERVKEVLYGPEVHH